jgi:hypothetical protein
MAKDKSVVSRQRIARHSSTPSERMWTAIQKRSFLHVLCVIPISWVFFPHLMFPTIPFLVLLLLINFSVKFTLPVHLPITAKKHYKLDHNNLRPARDRKQRSVRRPQGPKGCVYVGNVMDTDEQVWWDQPLTCTHLIFFATTGGGKTFSFTGLLANFIICSGFCYSDAKADLGLIENFARMIFRQGRINDLYILSFQQGNRSPWMINHGELISHSMNPCASSSAPLIAEVFKSLLDGEGDIWGKRADSFTSVLIRPITYMRDKFDWPMGFGVIASYFQLERLGHLCKIGLNKDEKYKIPEEDMKYFKPLIGFIETLPGMTDQFFQALVQQNQAAMAKITPTVRDQLGFVTMQLINVTNDLVGDYSHIFETDYGQLDLEDAMINRRFVLTLLPAMERSESSMATLGKIVLALQKSIVANAMPFQISGNLSEHIASRPTNTDYPYVSVNDEAGSFLTAGISTTTAQSRSSNVAFWFGGQDQQAMKKRGAIIEKEVDTIIGTTVNKLAGSLLDISTTEMFIKYADKELRLEATEMSREAKSGSYDRREENRLTVQERDVLTPKMLQDQSEGQAYLITKSKLNQITLPNYTTPDLGKKLSSFQMFETVPVKPMPIQELQTLSYLTEAYRDAVRDGKDLFGSLRNLKSVYISNLAERFTVILDASIDLENDAINKLSKSAHGILACTVYTREDHMRKAALNMVAYPSISVEDTHYIDTVWPTADKEEEDAYYVDETTSAAKYDVQSDISASISDIDEESEVLGGAAANVELGDIDDISIDDIHSLPPAKSMLDEYAGDEPVAFDKETVSASSGVADGDISSWAEGDLFSSFLNNDTDAGDDEGEESSGGAPLLPLSAEALTTPVSDEELLPMGLPRDDIIELNALLHEKGIHRVTTTDMVSEVLSDEPSGSFMPPIEYEGNIEDDLSVLDTLEAYNPTYSVSKESAISVLKRLTKSMKTQ